jgi:hypothetical protein
MPMSRLRFLRRDIALWRRFRGRTLCGRRWGRQPEGRFPESVAASKTPPHYDAVAFCFQANCVVSPEDIHQGYSAGQWQPTSDVAVRQVAHRRAALGANRVTGIGMVRELATDLCA